MMKTCVSTYGRNTRPCLFCLCNIQMRMSFVSYTSTMYCDVMSLSCHQSRFCQKLVLVGYCSCDFWCLMVCWYCDVMSLSCHQSRFCQKLVLVGYCSCDFWCLMVCWSVRERERREFAWNWLKQSADKTHYKTNLDIEIFSKTLKKLIGSCRLGSIIKIS